MRPAVAVRRVLLLVPSLTLLGACATAQVGTVGSRCGDVDDRSAAVAAALRAREGQERAVRVVTDEAVCKAAVAALRRSAGGDPRGVYVFRVGEEGFAVVEAAPAARETRTIPARGARVLLFDEDWRLQETATLRA